MSPDSFYLDQNDLENARTGLSDWHGELASVLDVGGDLEKNRETRTHQEAIEIVYSELGNVQVGARVLEVRKTLAALPLTEKVRSEIGKICPPLNISPEDLNEFQFEQALESLELGNFKMGGETFLRELLNSSRPSDPLILNEEFNSKILSLQSEVGEFFGEQYKPLVFFLLYLTGNATSVIETIEKQIKAHKNTMDGQNHEHHFFSHLTSFLNIYGDVSQYLREKGKRDEILEESKPILKEVIGSPALCQNKAVYSGSKINLFSLFQNSFRRIERESEENEFISTEEMPGDRKHPWFWGDLNDTPFDVNRLRELITKDVPREVLAPSLLAFNRYTKIQANQKMMEEMRVIIKAFDEESEKEKEKVYQETNKIYERIKQELSGLENPEEDPRLKKAGRKRKKALSAKKWMPGQVNNMLSFLEVYPDHFKISLKMRVKIIERKLKELEEQAPRPMQIVKMESGPDIHPQEIMLRVIKPRTIYLSEKAQDQFRDMMDKLREKLQGNNERLIFYYSIKILLRNQDPFLKIPIRRLENKSIRHHLMRLALDVFSKDQIRNGFHNEGKPLFDESDSRDEYFPKELNKNFNSAGVGIKKKSLLRVAEAMQKVHGFDKLMQFAKEQAEAYFQSEDHDYFFYGSATEAFANLIHQLPDLQDGDKAMISNQEYKSITKFFTRQGSPNKDVKIDVVWLNDKKERRPHTVEEMAENILKKVKKDKTRMIILSTKTRFGDAPCSLGDGKENVYYLVQLIAKLRKAEPDIPICLDACQALGRAPAEVLKLLNPDIYLTSGQKAFGVEHAAMMALWGRRFFGGLNNLAYNAYVYLLIYATYEYRSP